MLASKLVSGLTDVQWHVSGSLPEAEEVLRKTVRDTKVVQLFWSPFRQPLEKGRHALRVSDGDVVGLQRCTL